MNNFVLAGRRGRENSKYVVYMLKTGVLTA